MIKIAYIIDTIATPGAGTEKQLLLLLEKLDRSRFEPHLICLRESDWLKNNTLPVPVKIIGCGRMKSPRFFADIKKLSGYLRSERFQIAQTFFVDGNIYGTTAAHFAKIPVVISSRRNIGYWHDRLQLGILRFLRRWTTHYLANSQAVVEKTITTEGVNRDKLTLIYNGLDLDRFMQDSTEVRAQLRRDWAIADSEILIGSVANLRPVKNNESLIKAAGALAKKDERLRLVVVGEGSSRAACQRLIDELGMKERFHLVGAFADIVPCLAAFDIAVLASQSESFSNSLIEYMAAQKPIVASAVGGNVEAVENNRTGLLFDVDNPAALEEALARMIANQELAARLAQAAREDALNRYAWQKSVTAHEEFYSSIAGVRN